MDIRTQRSWMYNQLVQWRKTLTDEFIRGVNIFIHIACQLPSFMSDEMIRCPYSKHKNQVYLSPDDVIFDLYHRGFMPEYWYWTSHGEYEPHFDSQYGPSTSTHIDEEENIQLNLEDLINDASGAQFKQYTEAYNHCYWWIFTVTGFCPPITMIFFCSCSII